MGDLDTAATSRRLVPRNPRRTGSADREISGRIAQRRVALLLLPLRLYVGIAWLRYGVGKALQPEWLDGTGVSGWFSGQPEIAAPLSLYTDLLARLVERASAPLGIALLCAEIAIGLALLTGTLTNLALLTAIMINVNYLLAGIASPSQYEIVIQVVLLAGGAGAAYSGDRWLSRVVRSTLLTGHRGLIDGVDAAPSLLVLLAVLTGGLALAVVPAIGDVLPRQGAGDDPALALFTLLMVVALFALALTRATHRSSPADAADDWSEIGEGYGAAQLPPRPAQQRPAGTNGVSGRPPQQRPPAPSQPSPLPSAPVAQQAQLPPPQPPPRPQHQPQGPRPSSVPPATRRPAAQDQPTTQFVRPRRSRSANASADPYAELRDLPPVQQP